MRWYWYVVLGVIGYSVLFYDDDNANSARYSNSTTISTTADTQTGATVRQTSTNVISEKLFVTGNAVNVRAGPGVKFEILGKRYKGDTVYRLDQSGNWSKIRNGDGEAWISSNYVSRNAPSIAQPTQKTVPKRTVAVPSGRDVAAAKKEIIRWSISQYSGSCPCPYNIDRAGRRCGGRSAWSKPGGFSPMCYESDISDARVKSYLARKRGAVN